MVVHTNVIAIETRAQVLGSPSGHTWQVHLDFGGQFYAKCLCIPTFSIMAGFKTPQPAIINIALYTEDTAEEVWTKTPNSKLLSNCTQFYYNNCYINLFS